MSIIGEMISNANTVGSVSNAVVVKEKPENKSKRVNFLVKPSTYDAVKAKCEKMGISVNDAVNQLLEKWIAE